MLVNETVTVRPENQINKRMVLGWREWLALPALNVSAIKAKIDSGARSSALHVEAIQEFSRDGVEWVRFQLNPLTRPSKRMRWIEAPLYERRKVTDSGGNVSVRPFIKTLVRIGAGSFEIEVNLTNRRNMLFPMLLGRTAMSGLIVIDPQRSYVLGRPKKSSRKLPT